MYRDITAPRTLATIEAGRAILHPGHTACVRSVSVSVKNGRVQEMGTGRAKERGANNHLLLMPALVNAHDHGRGLRHLAFGARDELFETWRAALYAQPRIDPYLNAALAFGRLAEAGVGSTVCVYSSIDVERLSEDAQAIAKAARDVGIRLSLVVPLRDQRTMALGDDREVLKLHDETDQEEIKRSWLYPFPGADEYMQIVREVAKRIDGPTVSVQYGPNSPQACSRELLESIADASRADGRRVHMHLLESVPQREWADAAYPDGLLAFLDKIGLLSPRLTAAHGIWLSESECELLADRGCSIAVNSSSNLRLFSGLSPIPRYVKTGLKFAFGLDSFGLDDDDDMFREVRLSCWLHAANHIPHRLTVERAFDAALETGFEIVNNVGGYGVIQCGAPADFVLLDYDRMAYDVVEDMTPEFDVLLTRATSRFVRSLIVDGREVVAEGRVLGVDLPAIEREVLAQAASAAQRMGALRPLLGRHKQALKSFYSARGHVRARPSRAVLIGRNHD